MQQTNRGPAKRRAPAAVTKPGRRPGARRHDEALIQAEIRKLARALGPSRAWRVREPGSAAEPVAPRQAV